jgi:hypothetical protein
MRGPRCAPAADAAPDSCRSVHWSIHRRRPTAAHPLPPATERTSWSATATTSNRCGRWAPPPSPRRTVR